MARTWRRAWVRKTSRLIKGIFVMRVRRGGRKAAKALFMPACASTAFLLMMIKTVFALPTGGEVAVGSATINQNGNVMTISQNSPRLALNWQDFSIAAQEKVNFNQPSATAVALNRIVGNNPTAIFGQLSANGRVFLTNPNGILFAPGAQVNVGGLVASTLVISDGDFMAGRYQFHNSGDAGVVINQGSVTAADGSYVALFGPQVRNEGIVVAKQGTVALVAGDKVGMDMAGDGLVNFAVDTAAINAQVSNQGLIQSNGGQVLMTGRAANTITGAVVNNGGIIEAKSLSVHNGAIRLDGGDTGTVIVGGTLDASGKQQGETGGTVKILGDNVGLVDDARIDVTGDEGGGTAIIGGNFKGRGPEQNATATFVGKEVIIAADALAKGNGGSVALWADAATRFHGSISARGGEQSGDGGQVETSGGYLEADGVVNAAAPYGKGGEWLLDPSNITIQAGASNYSINGSPNFTATADSAILTTDSILSALNAGTNVTVMTGANGSQAGDITLNAAITKTGGGDAALTFNAHRDITLNAPVSSDIGKLSLIFDADSNRDGTGAVVVNSDITTNGGSILFGRDSISTAGTYLGGTGARNITTNGGKIIFNTTLDSDASTALTVNTAGGSVTFGDKVGSNTALAALSVNNSNVLLNTNLLKTINEMRTDNNSTITVGTGVNANITAGSIILRGPMKAIGTTTLTASGDVVLDNMANDLGTVMAQGNDVTLYDTDEICLGRSTISHNFVVQTMTGDIKNSGELIVAGDSSFTANGAGASIILGQSNRFTGNVEFFGVGGLANLIVNDYSGSFDLKAPNFLSGNLTIITNGDITQSNPIKVTGLTTLTSGMGHNINLDQADDFQKVQLRGAQDVTLNDVNGIVLGEAIVYGALNVAAAGPITDSGALTAYGTTTLAAGAGNNITLDNANEFGTVKVVSGKDVTLRDKNSIDLGTSTLSGNMAVTANTAITQSGDVLTNGNVTLTAKNGVSQAAGTKLMVNGTTIVDAGAGIIDLSQGVNQLTGGVTLANTGLSDIFLSNAQATYVTNVKAGQDLAIISSGGLKIDDATVGRDAVYTASGNANSIMFGNQVVGRTLHATATGNIGQAGGTTLNAANFAGQSGGNISLKENNSFNVVAVLATGGNDVTLRDDHDGFTVGMVGAVSGIDVGNDGNVHLISSKNVNQTAAIITGGLALTGSNGSFDLSTEPNAVNSLAANTATVNLNNTGALQIGNVTANGITTLGVVNTGGLTVTAAGTISQSQTVTVNGQTTINAGIHDIKFNMDSNDFAGSVSLVGGAATVHDANGINLGDAVTTADLTVVATHGGTIAGGDVTVGGNASLIAADGVGQNTGTKLVIAGTANVDAGYGSIEFDQGGNDFVGLVSLFNRGNYDITIRDRNGVNINTVTAGRDLYIRSTGTISRSGGINLPGNVYLDAGFGATVFKAADMLRIHSFPFTEPHGYRESLAFVKSLFEHTTGAMPDLFRQIVTQNYLMGNRAFSAAENPEISVVDGGVNITIKEKDIS